MKKIAFLFTTPPHGSSKGREGLDTILATSAFTEDISVFFVGDGVLQLLPEQDPELILARDYISTFKVLPLYDIHHCYVCIDSLAERGLMIDYSFLDVQYLPLTAIKQQLQRFDVVLTF